jgi:hypothetical protein
MLQNVQRERTPQLRVMAIAIADKNIPTDAVADNDGFKGMSRYSDRRNINSELSDDVIRI